MAPENQWVREHLIKNNFRLKEGDHPKVINFLFFLDLCLRRTYSFRRNNIAVRMNVLYFEEFNFQGIASVGQKAYLLAVKEANNDDKTKLDDFTHRLRFLSMFNQKFAWLFKLSVPETDWVDREIADRMTKKLVQDLADHYREMGWEVAQIVKQIYNAVTDEDERYWYRQFLEMQRYIDDEVPYQSDWATNPKHKNDIAIILKLCRSRRRVPSVSTTLYIQLLS